MRKHNHPNSFLPAIILLLLCSILYFLFFFGEEPDQTETEPAKAAEIFTGSAPATPAPTAVPVILNNTGSKSEAGAPLPKADKTPAGKDTLPLSRKALRKLSAGSVIDITKAGDTIMENGFYYEKIKGDVKGRIKGKSYAKDCTVPFEDLRYVRVLHYGFDQKVHIGELIVNAGIAKDIIDIFKELYKAEYPIERMVLVDEYDADDNASMADNNTSSFNYRLVPGSTHLSKHALGLAIDINPLYNPYVQYEKGKTVILPEEGSDYADRTLDCPYYINKKDLCYKAFTKRGFTWGGSWKNEPDYQHFQKTPE